MDICDNEFIDELNSTLTDESQLLSTGNYDTSSEHSCEKSRHQELHLRLTAAQEKIEKYESSISTIAEACLEIDSNLNIHLKSDDISQDESQKENDPQNIILYIKEYIYKLEEECKNLNVADNQISKTTERVLQEIDDTYNQLITNITNEINQKRNLMKLEAKVFASESLAPLKACRQEIKAQILDKKQAISQIESQLNDKDMSFNFELEDFFASNRTIGGIPAVPSIDELPYLNFKPPSWNQINQVLNQVYDLGSIMRLGPVQIIDIEEKPASLFVKWDIVDPEFATEEQTYILQKATGEIFDPTSDAFETIYKGDENCYFVKDLQLNQPITLRVGIQSLESCWSTPRIATTNIPSYAWNDNNNNYMITNNGKIAAKLVDTISTLFSKGAPLNANNIIEFKFLEMPKNGSNDEGIAIIDEPRGHNDSLQRKGSLFITPSGKIFMDGEEKLMRLPPIRSGVTIIFTILKKNDDILRINIECSEKAVTYDWHVQTPLFFAARLAGHSKWNLMVK